MPLPFQQNGIDSWQCALLSACVGCARTPIDTGLGVRMGIFNPGLGQVHLVARYRHMLSNHGGHHIPLPQCSTVLPKVLFQGSSSLANITLWALVTRDGIDHSLSLQLGEHRRARGMCWPRWLLSMCLYRATRWTCPRPGL